MNKERQRKLDARARRQASLKGSNTETAIAKIEKPKDEVRQTVAKPKTEPKIKAKVKTSGTVKATQKDVSKKKKHNSKAGKK